jgi:nucleotide-binding universal stress UspA family protein
MFHPHRILHPTDFSDSSAYAFDVACDLARQHQAMLLVLHVVETLGPENVTYGEAVTQLQPEGYRQRLWEELNRMTPRAPEGITMRHLLTEGDAAEEIRRVAEKHQCDLIVMGTHGRTGLDRLLMGSVAEKVVRLAPCPLLVVKSPAPKTPAA